MAMGDGGGRVLSAGLSGAGVAALSPVQVRMARAALRWTRTRLAAESGAAAGTIKRVEEGRPMLLETAVKLRGTFEREGLSFPEARTVMAAGPG